MLNFRKILFPVDFSERSKETAAYVAGIARRFSSQITLLHAVDLSLAAPHQLLRSELLRSREEWVREQRESDLREFAPGLFNGLLLSRAVQFGDAADVITRHAEQNEIALIIMPTHGWGTFRWLLLGSVTAKVLHDSACPVWTTVHSEALPLHAAGEIRSILCAVDLCSEPVRVIQAASDIAARWGAVVRVVHAISTQEGRPGTNMDSGLTRFLFDTAREQIAHCQQEAHADWEICIHSGGVSSVVREAAMHWEADLVVIGRGHLPNHFGRFRTNVGAIIRESPCPVLSV
jgi:nucleotide-binding universal stress UspA family protein